MSLSTLIVQREIASIREVEEALARQVLYGGDFVTNLLEVCRLDEAQLLPLVAESLGLPPAPAGELPRPQPEAQRLVAAEVALERNLAPLTVDRYGLTIAVAEPLSPDVEQELSFALALPISQKIAPLVRIKQALARDYGVGLDRRLQRLLKRMMTDGPRGGSSYPPMRNADLRLGAPKPPSATPPGPHSNPPQPVRPSVPPGGTSATLVRHSDVPAVRPVSRRRRGAITVDVARDELEAATERDTIFDLVFEFARQYFDYTASFILHGDLAEGRDAFGDGAARDKVARIGVPLDLPSILSAAREQKASVQRVPAPDGLDAVLMHDLGRNGKTACVVLPIIVRTRVVALLLGDGGESGIDLATLKDVEGIVVSATAAFERLIVRRKLKGSVMPTGLSNAPLAASMAPPTMVSEISDRPSAEELAPPIRELMSEPESRVGTTVREPVVQHYLPPDASTSALAGARGKSEQVPPPANLLTVRRPSGAPIPREEPLTRERVPAVTAPSNLAGAAQAAQAALRAALAVDVQPPAGAGGHGGGGFEAEEPAPISTSPRSRRRAEAPRFDFGALPTDSAMFGAETFASSDSERRLLAEIHGTPGEAAPEASPQRQAPARTDSGPVTDRDQGPPVPFSALAPANGDVPSSAPLSISVTFESFRDPPPSPKAESPPPMPVAARTTDMSPVAIPAAPSTPRMPNAPVREPESSPMAAARTPSSAPQSSEMISADDLDVDIVDPDSEPTPFAPPVAMTPHAPEAIPHAAPIPRPPETPWPSTLAAAVDAPSVRPPAPSSGKPMPASEQQISVPAHRPPSSRSDHERILPSVIVDVASEYVGLVDRVLGLAQPGGAASLEDAEAAEAELVRAGGYAMPAIMLRFPGPITIERDRLADGQLPRVAECGPILRVIASQRRTALPFVLSHVEDPDAEKRFWATYLLTELVYPDVLDPILHRLFDSEPRVRRAARAAGRAYAEVHPAGIVERLELTAMDGGEARHRRVLAIEALDEMREPLAVPALVPLLDDPDAEVVAAVRSALATITRQDFGPSSAKWAAWWEQNNDRHRLEWLIDALMHDQAALRASAGEELKTITKEYFGYYDDLPKRERERAQSRYREWWNSVGKVRFSRASSSRG